MAADEEKKSDDRLVKVDLDDAGMPRRSAEAAQERAIAIYDLLEANIFRLDDRSGPYHLCLRLEGRHVHFDIREVTDKSLIQFFMAMGPLRRVMRDYFHVCETYYDAIRTKSPSQIQAIDMGRRALHNDCLLYTSPSPRDQRGSRMPSSA